METYTVVSKDNEETDRSRIKVKKQFETYTLLTLADIDDKIQALTSRIARDLAEKTKLEQVREKVELEANKVSLKLITV